VEWTNEFSSGVALLDEHNMALVCRTGSIILAIREQVCRYTIGVEIGFLEKHIFSCFNKEEQYMQLYSFSEYPQHKAEHERFESDVRKLKKDFIGLDQSRQCGSYELSVEINCLIVNWVSGHISKTDKKLGAFLNRKMIFTEISGKKKIVVPVCSFCRKVRDYNGLWVQIKPHIIGYSGFAFSHGMCPDCARMHYAEYFSGDGYKQPAY